MPTILRTACAGLLVWGSLCGCAAPAGEEELCAWPSEDRVTLQGRFWAAGAQARGAVLLVHTVYRDRGEFEDVAPALQRAGFHVLAMDLRGHGRSAGTPAEAGLTTSDFARMSWDVAAGLRETARRADGLPVAVLGTSVGALAAVRETLQEPAPAALVLLSPLVKYRDLDAVEALEGYDGPVLLAAAREDERFPDAEVLAKLAGSRARLEAIAGAGHGTALLQGTQGPALLATIIAFLNKAFAAAAPDVAGPPDEPPPGATGGSGSRGPEAPPGATVPPAAAGDGPGERRAGSVSDGPGADDLLPRDPLPTPGQRRRGVAGGEEKIPAHGRDARATAHPGGAGVSPAPPGGDLHAELEALKERVAALERAKPGAAPPADSPFADQPAVAGGLLDRARASDTLRLGGHLDAAYVDPGGAAGDRLGRAGLGLWLTAEPVSALRLRGELLWTSADGVPDGEVGLRLEEARADFRPWAAFGLAGGVVRAPLGRANEGRYGFLRPLVSQPLSAETVLPYTWRDVGLGVAGVLPWRGERFAYEAFALNGLEGELFDVAGAARAVPGRDLDAAERDGVWAAGRVRWVSAIATGLEVGLAGAYGARNADHDVQSTIAALDGRYRLWRFDLEGEAALSVHEPDPAVRPVPRQMHGFWVQAVFPFWFEALEGSALGRAADGATLLAALRYDFVDTDRRAETQGDRRALAAGLAYQPWTGFRVKVEYRFDLDRGRIENLDEDAALFVGLAGRF